MKTKVYTETEIGSVIEVLEEVISTADLDKHSMGSLEDVKELLEGGVRQDGFREGTL